MEADHFEVGFNIIGVKDDGHAHTTTSVSGLVEADVGKVARQVDNDTWYILTSVDPDIWVALAGEGINDHGGLSGNLDDDHPQYLRVDGYRAMAGDLNMDGYAIECVGGMDMKGSIDMDGYDLLNVGELNGQQFYGPLASDPVSPVPEDGDLYHNLAIGELMFFDGSRGKWLSVKPYTVQAGRNGKTQAGIFYRGTDGMVLDDGYRGIPVPSGTLVSISLSKSSTDASSLEVLANGALAATLAHGASAGAIRDDTVNADFSDGLLSFRNVTGGAGIRNVQITALVRRRA